MLRRGHLQLLLEGVQSVREDVQDMEMFLKHQLFMAGLCHDLQIKVMEAGEATLHKSLQYAHELEVIHHDKRQPLVATVSTGSINNLLTAKAKEEDFTDEKLKAINATHFCQGKALFMSKFHWFNRNWSGKTKLTMFANTAKRLGMCRRTAGLISLQHCNG